MREVGGDAGRQCKKKNKNQKSYPCFSVFKPLRIGISARLFHAEAGSKGRGLQFISVQCWCNRASRKNRCPCVMMMTRNGGKEIEDEGVEAEERGEHIHN